MMHTICYKRRGSGFMIFLIGMLLLSLTFFSHQSKAVLDLLATQRKLLLKVRQGDVPDRKLSLTSREAVIVLPEKTE